MSDNGTQFIGQPFQDMCKVWNIRRTLPSHQLLAKDHDHENLLIKQEVMKDQHDRSAGPTLPPLHPGQKVYMQDTENKTWTPATVTEVAAEPRSYTVETPNGGRYRRNMFILMRTLKQNRGK